MPRRYTCHPGAKTQCLRGAMSKAIGPDGDKAMDCQSCHGDKNGRILGSPGLVRGAELRGVPRRLGHPEPGQIRYDHAFDANGDLRQATTNLFATNDDTPAPGISLYRFSTGHGDLQCSACHGPPHAIYPTSEANDNQQSVAFQGHEGTIQECSSCHNSLTAAQRVNGPHGMHPSNSAWVNNQHGDWVRTTARPPAGCATARIRAAPSFRKPKRTAPSTPNSRYEAVLPRVPGRLLRVPRWSERRRSQQQRAAPVVQNISVSTPSDLSIQIPFQGQRYANGTALTYKLITQPQSGTAEVGTRAAPRTTRTAPSRAR
ncbi:MAG: hypothetical protein R3E96_05585 [Planctomycetota bacterium]